MKLNSTQRSRNRRRVERGARFLDQNDPGWHDEIDLDAGVIRFKEGGGHGGHNGLRDIIEKMGGNEFNRLRIGVGHPGSSSEVVNYVLTRPSAEDEELIMQGIGDVMDLTPQILAGEFQKVMHKLHSSEKSKVKSEKDNNDDKKIDK